MKKLTAKSYKLKAQRKPLVSVVMPVYNAGDFLVEAIESILSQTYKDFEFIIVDDASTDNSLKILKKYAKFDKRIKLFRNTTKSGVSLTVKKAISHATGSYLARMDADDISLPNRLEKQMSYLKKHADTVVVGTQCFVLNKEGRIVGEKHFPVSFEEIYKYIFTFIPVQQPSLMIARTRLPENFDYYKDGMNTAEEVELLFKLFTYGKVENLPDLLLGYRIHGKNTSFLNLRQTFLLTLISRLKATVIYGYKPTMLGMVATIVQTGLVLVLPQRITLWLYSQIKHLFSKTAKNAYTKYRYSV